MTQYQTRTQAQMSRTFNELNAFDRMAEGYRQTHTPDAVVTTAFDDGEGGQVVIYFAKDGSDKLAENSVAKPKEDSMCVAHATAYYLPIAA